MLVPEDAGELAKLASAVFDNGGDIISFGTFLGTDPSNVLCAMKVTGMQKDTLTEILKPLVIEIEDVREV
jgi:acetoin utilization protein AcuB